METEPNRNRRMTIVGVAVLAAVLSLVALLMSRTPAESQIQYVGGDPAQLPAYAPAPQKLAAALGVRVDHVNLSTGGGGFAPGDCTALGPVSSQERHDYRMLSGERGLAITAVARMTDAAEASELMDRIRDDIEDCDRSKHRGFAHDLEETQDVDAGDRTFLLAAVNDRGTRNCWIWAQKKERVAHAGIYEFDPPPTVQQCVAASRVLADALGRD